MTWVQVPNTIEPGRVVSIEVDGRRIAVCRVDGQYYAIDDLCSHDGGPLDQGEVRDLEIECPRHGARFDVRSGRALCLPAVRPIKTYPTRLAGDAVEVEVV